MVPHRESIQKSASARELLERMMTGPAQHHPVTPPPLRRFIVKEFSVVDGPARYYPTNSGPETLPVFSPKEFNVIEESEKEE